jgi:hypothetical protein
MSNCLVVTPLSVVDLPESYKDALAGVTGNFRASFQPISSRLEAFGKVFQNGGTTNCLASEELSALRQY